MKQRTGALLVDTLISISDVSASIAIGHNKVTHEMGQCWTKLHHGSVLGMSLLLSKWEEKSLRHFAMVPKFLDENELKMSLKKYSYCFKVHRSYSILFNLYNCRQNFLRLNPKGPNLGLRKRKRKRKFLCCVHLLHKGGVWILEV